MKNILIALMLLTVVSYASNAQEGYLPYNQEDTPTWISTNYFGPNAFPVPDMAKNTTGSLVIQLNGTAAFGHLSPTMDKTVSADFKIRIPLWTNRVNLTIWGQCFEWYWDTPEVRVMRRVKPEEPLKGSLSGDIYFSVDMRIVNEGKYTPDVVLRAACKSASGGQYTRARYYDCPGYFFDVCASKNIPIGDLRISTALTGGFLCWQVDNGRQNDAIMYGASLGVNSKTMNVCADFGGYFGWKEEGDCPMTLKVKADILPEKMFTPFVEYQHGFCDWPFDQIKVGMRCALDILRRCCR